MKKKLEEKKINKDDIIKILVEKRLKEKITNYQMLDILMTEFGYQQSYAYDLMREVRLKITETYKKETIGLLEDAIGDLEDQRFEAKKDKNYKLLLEVTKELNKIKGLYIDRLDITGNIEHNIQVIKIISPGEKNNDE